MVKTNKKSNFQLIIDSYLSKFDDKTANFQVIQQFQPLYLL